jgi:hypothetical protein
MDVEPSTVLHADRRAAEGRGSQPRERENRYGPSRGGGRLQVASQQLPEPGEPPFAVQRGAVADTRQRLMMGHCSGAVHGVTRSWHLPFLHLPGYAKQQVTNPPLPQLERAAQRAMVPLQFTGKPFATARLIACTTQLTY